MFSRITKALLSIFPVSMRGFWWDYAKQDIRNKYTRSVLGPLWVTLSVSATIAGMGPLYGSLFGTVNAEYYLYLATGIVFWFYISGTIGESATALPAQEVFIKQTNYPVSIYVLRVAIRNLMILFHNIVVLFLIYFVVKDVSWQLLSVFPLILLIFLLLYLISIPVAVICARYRDIAQLVGNLLQMAMFLSPVFWIPSVSVERSTYIQLNPFVPLLDILRSPFDIGEFEINDLFFILFLILFFGFLTVYTLKKFSDKIVYWV